MIFASKFTGLKTADMESDIVFMIVNRGDNSSTASINLNKDEQENYRYFDLFTGVEYKQENGVIDIQLEVKGFATLFMTKNAISKDLQDLIDTMVKLNKTPLSSFNNDWKPLTQDQKGYESSETQGDTDGMILLERAKYNFKSHGT
jgi:hypothetical protein